MSRSAALRCSAALALLLPGLLPGTTRAQEPPRTGGPPVESTPLERYVARGLEANLELRQEALSADQARARWTARKRERLPSLSLQARYSRADGGRTFEIPTGDLVNPIHRALNDILAEPGEPDPFPMIDNERVNFLLAEEQETTLQARQVIWNPALNADIRSREALARAGQAGVDALRRRVVRDVRIAYYRYANAARQVEILDDALDRVRENERATTALRQAALTTPDRVHRARAERLDVEQQRTRAVARRENAAAALNLLLDRDPGAPVETSSRDLTLDPAVPPLRLAARGKTVDAAVARRPELRRLDHAVEAADAGADAVRGRTLPSLALAVDAGIQGTDYGIGPDQRFVMASLVLSWTFTEGAAERARVQEARLERDRLAAARRETERRLRVQVETAARNARVALANLSPAREREEAARSAFRLVSRRQDEGLATLLEFLDARATLTRARLGRAITETDALIRLAELDYAAAGALDLLDPDTQEPLP